MFNSIFLEKIVLYKGGSSNKFDKGTTAKVHCNIRQGTAPYDVRWTKEGLGNKLLPRMEIKDTNLIINDVKMSDKGNYTCHINNSISNASLTFEINIYGECNI